MVSRKWFRIYHGKKSFVEERLDGVASNDVLGCRVEVLSYGKIRYRLCSFTINGKPAGTPRYLEDVKLFPAIMINSPGAILDTNFGEKRFYHDPKGI